MLIDYNKFKKFINNLSKIDLKKYPKDKSAFPLDFKVVYKKKFILNFEYLSENLHCDVIGLIEKNKKKFLKTTEEMQKYKPVEEEVKKRIKSIVK